MEVYVITDKTTLIKTTKDLEKNLSQIIREDKMKVVVRNYNDRPLTEQMVAEINEIFEGTSFILCYCVS